MVALAGGAIALVACRQVLGVEDLGVSDAGEASSAEAGPGDAGTGCQALATTEACYSCCAELDGGDQSFFKDDLHACICQTECSADCPVYCQPPAAAESTDCDLCVFLGSFQPLGQCHDRAATAAEASAGTGAIYRCLAGCNVPSDDECSKLSTLRGCYDCCGGKHLAALSTLFGSPAAQACVCDAGCAGACPSYCPGGGVDVGACTRCALDSLVDGGCAATGAGLCNGDCQNMTACMQLCAQTQ
jgi:hypothetical protein